MISLLFRWLITSAILMLIAYLLPGIQVGNFVTALLAAFVLGALNLLVRPLVVLLTLPINLLTLGLFAFIINAMMFGLAGWIVPGFDVDSFWSALLGALLLSLLTGLFGMVTDREHPVR